jgi:hypothetical protein
MSISISQDGPVKNKLFCLLSVFSSFAAATQSPDEIVVAGGDIMPVTFLANMTMQHTPTSR